MASKQPKRKTLIADYLNKTLNYDNSNKRGLYDYDGTLSR